MQITRGTIHKAQKVVLYGIEGIGKSTFAAAFPNPVFIDTEGSTSHLDVARLPTPTSWTMLLEEIDYIKQNPQLCDTLVVDTIDWAERMCNEHICAKHNKKGIEDFGYGNGYVFAAEEIGRMLNTLQQAIDCGINVVLTAHAWIRKFEQPDEMGAYDRWELKLGAKSGSKTSALVKEWADAVLFANYETIAIKTDAGKTKAQGNKRVLYTQHHACWDAKNRWGLEPKIPFEYAQIAAHIPAKSVTTAPAPVSTPPTPAPIQTSAPAPVDNVPPPPPPPVAPAFVEISPEEAAEIEAALSMQELAETANNKPNGKIVYTCSKQHEQLADLMNQNGVSPEEIQEVVAMRGYYPKDTKIEKYDPAFVGGALVTAWSQVYEAIKNTRIPF